MKLPSAILLPAIMENTPWPYWTTVPSGSLYQANINRPMWTLTYSDNFYEQFLPRLNTTLGSELERLVKTTCKALFHPIRP